MIIISGKWYVNTAVHLWRFYFRYIRSNPEQMRNADRENWKACDRAIKRFSGPEQEILRAYYMTGYGNYEDLKAVKECAEQRGIAEAAAWDLIKLANYEVAIERGLMERRDNNGGKE